MATPGWEEEDNWELINDDGFVYKRKKRLRLDPTISASASAPPPDPAAEEKNRRKRKKRVLVKLKERYQNEIHQWELLSNTLKDLNLKTQIQQQQPHQPETNLQVPVESPVQSSDSTCRQLLDDLLAQVEAQDAMISNISKLCEAAEALCNAQEERSKQSFMVLPIWASSPRELMNSLCEW